MTANALFDFPQLRTGRVQIAVLNALRGLAVGSSRAGAFSGQTPDEMFFGTGAKVPEKLALSCH
jgi:hypothetical protein